MNRRLLASSFLTWFYEVSPLFNKLILCLRQRRKVLPSSEFKVYSIRSENSSHGRLLVINFLFFIFQIWNNIFALYFLSEVKPGFSPRKFNDVRLIFDSKYIRTRVGG